MVVSSQASTFAGRPIEQWDNEIGIQNADAAIRVGLDYDAWEDGTKLPDLLSELCEDPKAPQIKALVIGAWSFEPEDGASELYARLASPEIVARLSSLRALFVGDITGEECEISWITQSDVGPVLRAYPALEVLQVRGGNSLALSDLSSPALVKLVIETGGLPRSCIESVCNAKLPNLAHLELWLGSENYGADHSVDDLMPLLSGRLFPKLRYLGLRDSEYSDEIARVIADAPVLSQLETLDLSMGTLGDEGAEALLASPQIAKLATLDVSHHYMSDAMVKRLASIGPRLLSSEPQGADSNRRYIQVSE
ncbi:MAG: STM4015 family protein [Myxococcales bacterium]|nr:STM4015 family protein [Myxococcales bacterium]